MSDGEPDFFTDNSNHKLVLGSSFKSNSQTAFHTLRYDFKPASLDKQQEGDLEVGDANEVTVSLPHVQGSKTSCTVYKGSKKSVQKECVLIYDNVTGEFTLERIASQIQVKKTRDVGNSNFSSHPSLNAPSTAKVPKSLGSGSKQRSKLSALKKSFSKKNEKLLPIPDDSTQLSIAVSSDNLGKPLKAAVEKMDADKKNGAVSEKMEVDKKDSMFSTDESNSSSSSNGSSSSDNDSGSSSDENEADELDVMKKTPSAYNDTQLHADLELSESGSDSD